MLKSNAVNVELQASLRREVARNERVAGDLQRTRAQLSRELPHASLDASPVSNLLQQLQVPAACLVCIASFKADFCLALASMKVAR